MLLAAKLQRATALALVALDGVARRLLLCPPDLGREHLPWVRAAAGIDAECPAGSRPRPLPSGPMAGPAERSGSFSPPARPGAQRWSSTAWTAWRALPPGSRRWAAGRHDAPVWSTFYDTRRYGGLVILLRALLGGGTMVFSDAEHGAEAAPADFLARASAAGVTHMSGTPSHWRRALMSGHARSIDPHYVRLSGEVADQAILDQLRAAYPRAVVAHAFASTEAGVAFDVADGLAGFPAEWLGDGRRPAELRLADGTLRIRSPRAAARVLGGVDAPSPPVADADGWVDTGDLVEQRDGRCHFAGRREGVINVGGQKVFPEEVETVVNACPGVRMSRAGSKRSPITGAIVALEVVADQEGAAGDEAALRTLILTECRRRLPAHKVPALVRFVPRLDLTPAGKLARHGP